MEDWKKAWQPVIDRIGTDIGEDAQFGADAIDASAVRRYLEPLEFNCALHRDADVARGHGHADVIVPYTAATTFTIPPMWRAGQETLFPADDRNAQPERSAVKPDFPEFFPAFTGYFATDIEIDFVRPAHLGERLGRRGNRIVACDPKETRIGRGAFVKCETDIVTEFGEVIARMRTGTFLYVPHPESAK